MQRLPGWISRVDRDAVSLSGHALLPQGREVPVEITDLSREGCKIESAEPMKIGDRVILNVELFEKAAATVRWSLAGTAGLRFEEDDWT